MKTKKLHNQLTTLGLIAIGLVAVAIGLAAWFVLAYWAGVGTLAAQDWLFELPPESFSTQATLAIGSVSLFMLGMCLPRALSGLAVCGFFLVELVDDWLQRAERLKSE